MLSPEETQTLTGEKSIIISSFAEPSSQISLLFPVTLHPLFSPIAPPSSRNSPKPNLPPPLSNLSSQLMEPRIRSNWKRRRKRLGLQRKLLGGGLVSLTRTGGGSIAEVAMTEAREERE